MPRISVVIPTYNRINTVGRAIDSAREQTLRPHEIIVVDDGSGDGTADMLATTYGDAIRIVGQPNGGAARARNTGILQASGELVAFLDSDDVWDPEKLAAQLTALEGSAAVLNYTNYRYLDRPEHDKFSSIGLILPSECTIFETPLELLTRWGTAGAHLSGTLVGRQALLDAGLFDAGLRVAEDTKLFLALARRGAFSLLRDPLWSRSQAIDPVTLTVPSDDAYQREHTSAVIPLLEALRLDAAHDSPALRRNLRHLLAYFVMKQARFHARDGRRAEARRLAASSLAYAPFSRTALRAALLALAPAAASRLMPLQTAR